MHEFLRQFSARHATLALMTLVMLPASSLAAPLEVQALGTGVWAIIGPTTQRSAENLGNNATFGLIETSEGSILIDAGGSAAGAEALAHAAATVTSQPVRLVINTGGQDHRWLGNGWFHTQGAKIIASEAAVADQSARADAQMTAMQAQIGNDLFAGTTARHADETVTGQRSLTMGGTEVTLIPTAGAHTPGDMIVWLADSRIAFTGDIVYHDRLLGVIDVSDTRNWLESFDTLAALEPRIVVPGHGRPGPLRQAEEQTRDYLLTIRGEVHTVLENNGDEAAATAIDQGAFAHLANFDELAGRNALQTFIQMEWE